MYLNVLYPLPVWLGWMDYLTVIDACFACTCADVSKVRFKLGEVSAKRPVLLQTAAEVVWIPGSRMQKGLVDKKK
jgi:hypothetical protein